MPSGTVTCFGGGDPAGALTSKSALFGPVRLTTYFTMSGSHRSHVRVTTRVLLSSARLKFVGVIGGCESSVNGCDGAVCAIWPLSSYAVARATLSPLTALHDV